MRLDKRIAETGLTRKEAKAAIAQGRVTVNGAQVKDAGLILPPGADVYLDGQSVTTETQIHLMLNKPAGVLTAARDARAKTVFDLLPPEVRALRPGPVGRLDKDVTGLLLFTTNGQLAHRLISPKRDIEKKYVARVEGPLTESDRERFEAGIPLSDFTAKPARLVIVEAGETSVCEVYVTEGKFHQVKRMLSAIGHPVITLNRESVAGLTLDEALAPGAWRRLTQREYERLLKAAEMKPYE